MVGAMTCHLVKPKTTLSFSWFLIESRYRQRRYRVTQRDVDEPTNVSVRFAPGQKAAYVTATTLTDIFYLSHRHAGLAKAWQSVHYLLNHLPIISVGIDELRAAATLEGHDFEDNLQIACATRMQLDAIVTRDSTFCCSQGVRRMLLVR